MYKNSLKLIAFIGVFTFCSCTFVRYMGTSSPRDESQDEIEVYFLKNNIDFYDYSFLLIDSLADSLSTKKHELNTWKLKHNTPSSAIQLRVYDSSGALVNGYTQCFGDFNRLNILKDINLVYFDHLPISYDLRLEDEFILTDANPKQIAQIMNNCKDHRYTVVFYWNIWSNYYSKVVFRELKRFKEKISDTDDAIQIILVNSAI